jgi:ribosomal protein L32
MPEKARDNPLHRLPDWRLTLPLAQSCPRCGARTRSGTKCKAPAMSNGRCRMHGGKSTGPRTSEGLECMRQANTRHGNYSEESRQLMRAVRRLIAEARQMAEET